VVLALSGLLLSGCLRTTTPPAPAPKAPEPPRERAAPAPAPEPVREVEERRWFQPRSAWAGQTIDTSNIEPMEPAYRITVHHSGDVADATGETKHQLRLFERAHKGKGWACIGYHYLIARDGTVYEGRPMTYQGAHATGANNVGNIGVCLMGNFDLRPVPAAQKDSLIRVLDRLRREHGIERREVKVHSDYKNTECPGRFLKGIVRSYSRG
jgi:hypothetical protein